MSFEFKSISGDKEMTDAICERIRKLLVKNNYSQLQLSRMMKVSKSTVNNWVHGEALTLDAIYNLAQFFGCSIDYLITGIGNSTKPEKEIVDDYGISNEVKVFYSHIQDEEINNLSLTDCLNFLISDDLFYLGDNNVIINRDFAETWATYLSIDPDPDSCIAVYDHSRHLDYSVDSATIEELELLKITKILREKKEYFKHTNAFKKIHKKNMIRKDTIHAEEQLYIQKENLGYFQGTEPSPKELKHFSKIADLDNPLPWEKGGKL